MSILNSNYFLINLALGFGGGILLHHLLCNDHHHVFDSFATIDTKNKSKTKHFATGKEYVDVLKGQAKLDHTFTPGGSYYFRKKPHIKSMPGNTVSKKYLLHRVDPIDNVILDRV